jgi:hypothetical protein
MVLTTRSGSSKKSYLVRSLVSRTTSDFLWNPEYIFICLTRGVHAGGGCRSSRILRRLGGGRGFPVRAPRSPRRRGRLLLEDLHNTAQHSTGGQEERKGSVSGRAGGMHPRAKATKSHSRSGKTACCPSRWASWLSRRVLMLMLTPGRRAYRHRCPRFPCCSLPRRHPTAESPNMNTTMGKSAQQMKSDGCNTDAVKHRRDGARDARREPSDSTNTFGRPPTPWLHVPSRPVPADVVVILRPCAVGTRSSRTTITVNRPHHITSLTRTL